MELTDNFKNAIWSMDAIRNLGSTYKYFLEHSQPAGYPNSVFTSMRMQKADEELLGLIDATEKAVVQWIMNQPFSHELSRMGSPDTDPLHEKVLDETFKNQLLRQRINQLLLAQEAMQISAPDSEKCKKLIASLKGSVVEQYATLMDFQEKHPEIMRQITRNVAPRVANSTQSAESFVSAESGSSNANVQESNLANIPAAAYGLVGRNPNGTRAGASVRHRKTRKQRGGAEQAVVPASGTGRFIGFLPNGIMQGALAVISRMGLPFNNNWILSFLVGLGLREAATNITNYSLEQVRVLGSQIPRIYYHSYTKFLYRQFSSDLISEHTGDTSPIARDVIFARYGFRVIFYTLMLSCLQQAATRLTNGIVKAGIEIPKGYLRQHEVLLAFLGARIVRLKAQVTGFVTEYIEKCAEKLDISPVPIEGGTRGTLQRATTLSDLADQLSAAAYQNLPRAVIATGPEAESIINPSTGKKRIPFINPWSQNAPLAMDDPVRKSWEEFQRIIETREVPGILYGTRTVEQVRQRSPRASDFADDLTDFQQYLLQIVSNAYTTVHPQNNYYAAHFREYVQLLRITYMFNTYFQDPLKIQQSGLIEGSSNLKGNLQQTIDTKKRYLEENPNIPASQLAEERRVLGKAYKLKAMLDSAANDPTAFVELIQYYLKTVRKTIESTNGMFTLTDFFAQIIISLTDNDPLYWLQVMRSDQGIVTAANYLKQKNSQRLVASIF